MAALVGESGSGKSTPAKLPVHFYDLNRGRITLGGQDLTDMSIEALNEQQRISIAHRLNTIENADRILLPWFVEWNGENAKEKFWNVHNAMYPLHQVEYKDFCIDDFVKKLMKLNYDLIILDNLTMDGWVKKYGTAEKCGDEEIQAIIDAQFGAFGRDGGIPTFPRKTSVAQMTQALKDVNAGKYIYNP